MFATESRKNCPDSTSTGTYETLDNNVASPNRAIISSKVGIWKCTGIVTEFNFL